MIANDRRQQGYTLIEIMVVIAVLALIATIAAGSISQTLNRRYSTEAERLSIWFNQLSDFSVMQGAAFGVLSEIDKKSKRPTQLSAVIYYRNKWVKVSYPKPYIFGEGADIEWVVDNPGNEPLVYQQAALASREELQQSAGRQAKGEDELLEPALAFLPDGYIEPEAVIELSFQDYESSYSYYWDTENLRIKMEKNKQ